MHAHNTTLKTYRRIAFWLPFERLSSKMFAVTFCAAQVPMLAVISYLIIRKSELSTMQAAALTLTAALAGAGMALWALHHLLAPVRLALRALRTYGSHHKVMPLPTDIRDDMGDLLRDLRMALEAVEERRGELQQLAMQDRVTGLSNHPAQMNT